MVTDGLRALDELLLRGVAATRAWERTAFDRLSQGRSIVLMGAGGLGRRTLAGLRRHGVAPLAFADNSPGAQGRAIDGVPVLSPAEAAQQFGERAAFVVTIWGANRPHRYAHSRAQLESLGCDVVCPFPPLLWKHADALLPFYLQDLPSRLVEESAGVRRAFDVWEDEASRREYVAQVRFRALADFDGLPHPTPEPQYFPKDLISWSESEWLVDGGAYDGDTLRFVTERFGGRFARILALEPDPSNFARLEKVAAELPPDVRSRVECRQIAVAARRGTLYINATGTAASATTVRSFADTIEVQADTIDSLVNGERPTFIKLDIEGAEIDALSGARRTIESAGPILAVCVYHAQNHLWKIPLLLREWCPNHALFLRPHNEEGWDLVCYAVPRERLSKRRA